MQHCARILPLMIVLLGNLFMFSVPSHGQSEPDDGRTGTKIIFHVTAVSQKDETACDPTACSSVEFKIEGHAGRIAYVLTCSEYWVFKPTPHTSMACARMHANSDYDGRLLADAIDFWPEEKYNPPPIRVLYKIVSETEVSK